MVRNVVELAAEVVTSYVSYNSVPRSELPDLVQKVHDALTRIENGAKVEAAQMEAKTPAVPVRRSVTPDYLICLDDGLRFKSLRRHLAKLGMTPAQYRQKWNLPTDYPMVAPNYATARSALAKQMGFGQRRSRRNSKAS